MCNVSNSSNSTPKNTFFDLNTTFSKLPVFRLFGPKNGGGWATRAAQRPEELLILGNRVAKRPDLPKIRRFERGRPRSGLPRSYFLVAVGRGFLATRAAKRPEELWTFSSLCVTDKLNWTVFALLVKTRPAKRVVSWANRTAQRSDELVSLCYVYLFFFFSSFFIFFIKKGLSLKYLKQGFSNTKQ